MECVPAPAAAGSKVPPVTPVPEYIPPTGSPPVRAKGSASRQTGSKAARVTVGSE